MFMKDVDIQFYGERGIVNGILLDIGTDKKKLNNFFQAIKLFGTEELPWKKGIDSCKWIVEPDLADFGNPDLIAIIKSDGKTFVLFIEAKLMSYSDSCYTFTEHVEADHLRGKSSMLNVQLALRYRFMKSLLKSPTGNSSLSPIEEINSPYLDYKKSPRKLQKPSVLKAIKDNLHGVPEEYYYFIALTNDQLEENTQWKPEKNHLPPLFQRAPQSNHHVNANILKYLGLLTYQTLITQGVVCENKGFFGKARKMMGMSIEKVSLLSASNAIQKKHLVGIPFDKWGDVRKNWAEQFKEENPRLKLKRESGSYSANNPDKRVVMKLMPRKKDDNLLVLGLYDNNRIRLDVAKPIQPFIGTVGQNKKEFLFFPFDVSNNEECEKIKQLALFYMESWENDELES
jgi:hypothetical protein